MVGTVLNVAKPFENYKSKWEDLLFGMYPQHFEEGCIGAIHVGRNNDSAAGMTGGFKVRGPSVQNSALYLQLPDRMFPTRVLADNTLKQAAAVSRINDSVAAYANELVAKQIEKGKTLEEARIAVADSITKVGYLDAKLGKYVIEPVIKGVNDSMLSGLATPLWNVSQIPKIYKQPYLRGYADRLVSKMGVPNIWADIIQIFTASYEGAARLSSVGRASLEFNTSIAGRRKVGTMLSELINLVIDYETQSPDEQAIAGQGAWLVSATVGDQDVYADLMLELLMNTLLYFGHDEFDGLTQIAVRDDTYTQYPSDRPTAEYLWENDGAGSGAGPVNDTVGADLLQMLNHFLADKVEEMNFLPTSIKVNCGSMLYKALHYSMLSKRYNQNNPLSIINTAFASGNKIVGTFATKSVESVQRTFEICPDPLLNPGTPFNPTDEDIMFITFPSMQSELEVDNVLSDLVMMPQAIDKMILPSAPAYRDGMVRTALKRIGSLLCPVRKCVHVITGMGTNGRYTPTGTITPVQVEIVNTDANPVLTQEVV
jgi:hypothetical protein